MTLNIFNIIFSLVTSFLVIRLFNFRPGTIFYLVLIPFVVLSPLTPIQLFLSFLIGLSLFYFLTTNKSPFLILTVIILITILVIFRPQLDLEPGFLNLINSQRGTHPNPGSLFAIIFHNKLDYLYIVFRNLQSRLSLLTLFAKADYGFNKYYPLGYLFPTDLFVLLSGLSTARLTIKHKLIRIIFTLSLVALIALLNTPTAYVILFGIIYSMTFLISKILNTFSKKVFITLTCFNLAYIASHLLLIPLFK